MVQKAKYSARQGVYLRPATIAKLACLQSLFSTEDSVVSVSEVIRIAINELYKRRIRVKESRDSHFGVEDR
jgi:hypothetical protein